MITTVIYGCGKKTVIKKVKKSSEARVLIHECGDALSIPVHVLNNRKNIVNKYVYGKKGDGLCRDMGNTMGKNQKEEHAKTNAR